MEKSVLETKKKRAVAAHYFMGIVLVFLPDV
jgi:hypothetical protein